MNNVESMFPAGYPRKYTPPPPSFFSSISDTYYAENYHSDIIRFLLLSEQDNLNQFIDWINRQKGFSISHADFGRYRVEREADRVDLAVLSECSRKAILIENKSNGANDRERQLPKYYARWSEAGYHIAAIVYIKLMSLTGPNDETWTKNDQLAVHPITMVTRLYGKEESMCGGWLKQVAHSSMDPDTLFVVKHFTRLIELLVSGGGDMTALEEFHDYLMNQDGFKKVAFIEQMKTDYPAFLARLLWDKINQGDTAPFSLPEIYQQNSVVLQYRLHPNLYKIQVYPYLPFVSIQMFAQDAEIDNVISLLRRSGALDLLPETSDDNYRRFKNIPNPDGVLKTPAAVAEIISRIRSAIT